MQRHNLTRDIGGRADGFVPAHALWSRAAHVFGKFRVGLLTADHAVADPVDEGIEKAVHDSYGIPANPLVELIPGLFEKLPVVDPLRTRLGVLEDFVTLVVIDANRNGDLQFVQRVNSRCLGKSFEKAVYGVHVRILTYMG